MANNYRYPLYRMRHKAVFGIPDDQENAMGVTIPKFKELMTLHYAKIKLTLNQRYGVTGSNLQHAVIIAVRHNNKLSSKMQVKLADGITYSISEISSNDDDYISYDLLTLHKVNKVGSDNNG